MATYTELKLIHDITSQYMCECNEIIVLLLLLYLLCTLQKKTYTHKHILYTRLIQYNVDYIKTQEYTQVKRSFKLVTPEKLT